MSTKVDLILAGECLDFAQRLLPAAMYAKVRDYAKDGLPGSSVPEAISRTSDPSLPRFDQMDVDAKKALRDYSRTIRDAHGLLRSAVALQTAFVEGIAKDAPEIEDVSALCDNGLCVRPVQKGRTKCAACRKWHERHGVWPAKPEQVTEDAA